MKDVLRHWRYWAPAGACFGVTAAFTLIFHYPTLYFDHWDLVPLYQRMMSGNLAWTDLFAPHGTHWHAGGYAIMLALAAVTGMTQTPEVIASLLLALFACVTLCTMLQGAWRELNQPAAPLLFAVFAFFVFSADQSENWLWGWQVSLFLNVAGASLCLALLSRRDAKAMSLLGAMLAAALAIFSFATGLALLPAGFIVLWLRRPRLDLRLAAWGAFSLAITLLYKTVMLDAQPQYVASITPHTMGAGALLSLATFTIDMLGGAVGRFSDGVPLIATLVGLGIGGYSFARLDPEQRAATAGVTGLALYGLGAAALIAFGRLGFDTAAISRYITFANFFWMGVVALAFFAVRAKPNRIASNTARALLVVLIIGKAATIGNVLSSSSAGLAHADDIRRVGGVLCRAYPDIPNEVRAEISAPHQHIEPLLDYIARQRLSIFHACPGVSE